jgi:hypothetical protein
MKLLDRLSECLDSAAARNALLEQLKSSRKMTSDSAAGHAADTMASLRELCSADGEPFKQTKTITVELTLQCIRLFCPQRPASFEGQAFDDRLCIFTLDAGIKLAEVTDSEIARFVEVRARNTVPTTQ